MKNPNWKNEGDYSYTKGFTCVEWAWEFLRRNPTYRKDYSELMSGQLESWGYSPVKLKDETETQWRYRCIHVLDVTPHKLPRDKLIAQNWGLNGNVFDPAYTAMELAENGTPVQFDVDVKVEFYKYWEELFELPTIVESDGTTAIRSDRLVVSIDLNGSKTPQWKQISSQIDKAKNKLQNNLNTSEKFSGKPQWNAFKKGIRALDASELKITNHDIGELLFQHDNVDVDVSVSDCLKSARLNRDYRYRSIARRRSPIPK